jgi:hypothetical protein
VVSDQGWSAARQAEEWHVHPGEVGGWCVSTSPVAPLDGGRDVVAECPTRELAEYVAELHNRQHRDPSVPRPDELAAAFRLARAFGGPVFRDVLRSHGVGEPDGPKVVAAIPGETVAALLDRMSTEGRRLVGVEDDRAVGGWRLAWVEVPAVEAASAPAGETMRR